MAVTGWWNSLDPIAAGAIGFVLLVGLIYVVSPRGVQRDDSAKRLLARAWRVLYGSACGAGLAFIAHRVGARFGLNGWESYGATIAVAVAVSLLTIGIRDKIAKRAEQAG